MSDKRLEEMADEATAFWLARSSICFLECAIHLLMTHLDKDEVVTILRAEAQMIEDLD